MRKFGLIGYPLGHSFSKGYFAEKFRKEKITDCSYDNYPLENIDLFPELLKMEPDLCGLNVTIPYKSAIFRFIDNIDAEAAAVGALNVIKIRHLEGRTLLSGYNSDVTGILDSLSPYIPDIKKSALVLGTGGSSRAVCFVLKKLGIEVTLVSRRGGGGILSYQEIDRNIMERTGLIVNTTPLGMYPDTGSCPDINYDLLSRQHILFDLVYNPEMTSFLRIGSEKGCKVITGLKMLYSQAEKAWKIWNDDDQQTENRC